MTVSMHAIEQNIPLVSETTYISVLIEFDHLLGGTLWWQTEESFDHGYLVGVIKWVEHKHWGLNVFIEVLHA